MIHYANPETYVIVHDPAVFPLTSIFSVKSTENFYLSLMFSPTLFRGRVIDEEISRAFQQLECEDIHWDPVFYEVNPAGDSIYTTVRS